MHELRKYEWVQLGACSANTLVRETLGKGTALAAPKQERALTELTVQGEMP